MKSLAAAVVVGLMAGQAFAGQAPSAPPDARVALIYTGRSLGALGVLRNPSEHELVVEEAQKQDLPVRFGTNLCWRAGATTFFALDGDLSQNDLTELLAGRVRLEPPAEARVLVSNNAILLDDPRPRDGSQRSLLDTALSNPRAAGDFPDLRASTARLRRAVFADGREVAVLSEDGGDWPTDAAAWMRGEVETIAVSGSRLYEIAVNLGPMGSRATLITRMTSAARASGAEPLLVDLGHRDGDLGLARLDRARVDYAALARLGYRFVVPYEFELALGASGLDALRQENPGIEFIASNVTLKDQERKLFAPRRIVEVDGVKIGLIGLVDPDIAGLLAASSLAEFRFEAPLEAADREVAALRDEGVDAVIALSNLHPRDNNFLAREILGVDAIVADLHVRWSPEDVRTEVWLPDRPLSRPGSPALVPRSFANGLGVGELDLSFVRRDGSARPYLRALSHALESVTDRVPADVGLVTEVRRLAAASERPRGPILIPPFSALVQARPGLAGYDATTAQGRVSKRMWEEFLARLLRARTETEVAIIRKLPHFPPAVGALHEAEVRAWLWTEDAVVTLDLAGADLRSVLAEDAGGDLAVVGVDRRAGTVNGRRIQDGVLYRVATSDLLLDGARFRALARGRRVQRRFRVEENGRLKSSGKGDVWLLKDFVLHDLNRLQVSLDSGTVIESVARLLDRDRPFEPLVTLTFDRPMLMSSVNRVKTSDAYGSVSENRVNSPNSFIFGVSGRLAVGYDRPQYRFDLGTSFAYGRLSQDSPRRGKFETVTSDDFTLDFSVTSKRLQQRNTWRPELLGRVEYDTQFSRTRNRVTGGQNPRENLWRGYFGMTAEPGSRWEAVELTGVVEHDLWYGEIDWGIGGRATYRRPFGSTRRVTYVHDSQLLYLFTANHEESTGLGLRYRMLHELLIPLAAELSLSVGVDVLVFQGKARVIQPLGWSTLFRAGLTYNRIWKPRHQPFF